MRFITNIPAHQADLARECIEKSGVKFKVLDRPASSEEVNSPDYNPEIAANSKMVALMAESYEPSSAVDRFWKLFPYQFYSDAIEDEPEALNM